MNKPKISKLFLLAFSALATVSIIGCQSGKDFPFYQMKKHENDSEYVWMPAKVIREQIGVCGIEGPL